MRDFTIFGPYLRVSATYTTSSVINVFNPSLNKQLTSLFPPSIVVCISPGPIWRNIMCSDCSR